VRFLGRWPQLAAVQSVLPLPWKEASTEPVNATAYATRYHSELAGCAARTKVARQGRI